MHVVDHGNMISDIIAALGGLDYQSSVTRLRSFVRARSECRESPTCGFVLRSTQPTVRARLRVMEGLEFIDEDETARPGCLGALGRNL